MKRDDGDGRGRHLSAGLLRQDRRPEDKGSKKRRNCDRSDVFHDLARRQLEKVRSGTAIGCRSKGVRPIYADIALTAITETVRGAAITILGAGTCWRNESPQPAGGQTERLAVLRFRDRKKPPLLGLKLTSNDG